MAASSSTTTLALCSSFSSFCKISNKISPPLLSFSKPKLPASLLFSTTKQPTFSFASKCSASEAPAVSDSEPTPVVEAPAPEEKKPKREEIFAVVMIGSRQYIVFPGRYIYTQRLKGANVNDKIILSKVLLVGTKTTTYIGKPIVTNAAVHAVVEEQGLNPKVIVFKYKRKKNYRRNIGHRQLGKYEL
ncbi:50S ribosomal protein L21, chloroplastic-like isoform X2 [Mangifera indica]|uniref:50S ribosomal protein L21, chloroplastic-like isoform X2 n=1 Tax=Mangifera indica TaxID=29780 RepID=UPI001CFA7A40|nr:50S ribosomal protein L21, chloroplastic-like isoform X2 [Mangifera indica]